MILEDANGDQVVMGMKPYGIVTFIEDGEGNVRTAQYDDGDLLKNLTFPDGTIEKYEYDDIKQLEKFTNRAGDVTSFEWDGEGNAVTKVLPNSGIVHYLYDIRGYLVEASNAVGKMFFSYNDDGTPSMVRYANGKELHYRYDGKSRRTGLTDNEGYNISYVYNKKGQLHQVIDNSHGGIALLTVEYDVQGRIVRQVNSNNCSTDISYNKRGKRQEKRETACKTLDSSDVILTTKYTYDHRNRIKYRNSSYGFWSYGYDAASQLTSWIDPSGTETVIVYDRARNRRVVSTDGEERFYEVNSLSQYESFGSDVDFSYDQNGRLVRIVDRDAAKTERFSFNDENKVVEIATSDELCTFSYDAMGNLYQMVCGTTTTDFLVDPFGLSGADIVTEVSFITK